VSACRPNEPLRGSRISTSGSSVRAIRLTVDPSDAIRIDHMKKATVRNKDWADAASIVEQFGPQED